MNLDLFKEILEAGKFVGSDEVFRNVIIRYRAGTLLIVGSDRSVLYCFTTQNIAFSKDFDFFLDVDTLNMFKKIKNVKNLMLDENKLTLTINEHKIESRNINYPRLEEVLEIPERGVTIKTKKIKQLIEKIKKSALDKSLITIDKKISVDMDGLEFIIDEIDIEGGVKKLKGKYFFDFFDTYEFEEITLSYEPTRPTSPCYFVNEKYGNKYVFIIMPLG